MTTSTTRRIPGLRQSVELWRDAWGIAHVYAHSAQDAWFAQGHIHARDRLWQMDALRRRTLGRYAEWLGEAALPMDILARRMNQAACCQRDWAAASQETRAMLAAYTAGVNAAIDALVRDNALPIEYRHLGEQPEPWLDWHCIAVLRQTSLILHSVYPKLWRAAALPVLGLAGIVRLRADDGSEDGNGELLCMPPGSSAARQAPSIPDKADLSALCADATATEDIRALAQAALALLQQTQPPDATGGGSNNWALAGSRTASGKPLLAGDPHRMLEIPAMYQQCHVACDDFDAIGMTTPGVPGFPHFGHNAHVAWGVTVAYMDTCDVYLERFQDDGRRYLARAAEDGSAAQWADTTRRTEQIRVRGRSAPLACEVVETARGPVVAGAPRSGSALVLRNAADVETDYSFDCLAPMLQARSVEELHAACRPFGLIDHNLVAADSGGHIGHMVRARVPRRSSSNGWLPVPGWLARHDWQGWIAWQDMPRHTDPAGGQIVTANHRVTATHPDYLCTDCHPPHRARRIWQRLQDMPQATVDDMQAVHRDVLSIPARQLCQRLNTIDPAACARLSQRASTLRQQLVHWDAHMHAESPQAAAYNAVRQALASELVRRSGLEAALARQAPHSIPPGLFAAQQLGWSVPQLLRQGDTTLLGGASWDTVLCAALESAAAQPQAPWGAQHRLLLRHPLGAVFAHEALFAARDQGGVAGDTETVFTTGHVPHLGAQVVYASIGRYVFDVADWDASRWIVFQGNAGDPASRHYDDQSSTWCQGRTVPMTYTREAIKKTAAAHESWQPLRD